MQFCIISPVRWLKRFATQSNCHLVLAQHLGDSEYLSFYRQAVERGDTVILDNGAYEDEQISPMELVQCIKALKPTFYILPDEPGDFQISNMSSMDFIKFAKPYNVPGRALWVVHAEDGDLPNFVNSYELGIRYAAGVCFSRLTKAYGLVGEEPARRRIQFIQYLKRLDKWNPLNKYHHCLGMLNGNTDELSYLCGEGIDSLDSSAPVWRGLMGYRLHEYWPDFKFKLHPQVWSNAPTENGPKGESLAQSNLTKVLELCKSK